MTARHLICVPVAAIILHGLVTVTHCQTLNGPSSVAVERGTDTVLRCTLTGGTTQRFIWSDESVSPTVIIFLGGSPEAENNEKYNDFSVSEDSTSSTLTITDTQIEEEGSYVCQALGTSEPAAAQVTVEVRSTLSIELSSTVIAGDTYEAVCRAEGGRPTEDIAWYLNNVQQTVDPSTSVPNAGNADLTDTTSTFTFTPTKGNNGQSLRCETTGHQVVSLNQQQSVSLNVRFPPDADIIRIYFTEDTSTTRLTVACFIPSSDQPNPIVDMYYIFEDVTDNSSPISSASIFTRALPDFETEYLCVGGNYLGNTTATRTFVPRNVVCPCDCLSPGMIAAVSILSLLLAVSLAVNVMQFYKRSITSSKASNKADKSARTVISGGNENNAYEIIDSEKKDNAVYQPLSPSTAAVEADNLTFFSRLGSIGLGKFGDVWKGDLRTKQGPTSVSLRQITENNPDVQQLVTHLRKLLNHQNIVKCLGYCGEYRTIVCEFVSGGTLLTFLQFSNQSPRSPYSNIKPARPRFDESKLLKYAWQVAKGMEFLASKKIVHGNLCAHNILMTEDRICKISDYGMTSLNSRSGNKPTRWVSPEGMQTKNFSLEGDVWSYGILLWEIVTLGARPYPKMTMDMVKQQVTNGYKMPRPSHCGQELFLIMQGCWEMEPEKRCGYHDIQRKLEPKLEVYHEYLSLRNLDERLYESVEDATV